MLDTNSARSEDLSHPVYKLGGRPEMPHLAVVSEGLLDTGGGKIRDLFGSDCSGFESRELRIVQLQLPGLVFSLEVLKALILSEP